MTKTENLQQHRLKEEIVAQNKNMLQSYMDLEPATGLGIRSKLRFGIRYSV